MFRIILHVLIDSNFPPLRVARTGSEHVIGGIFAEARWKLSHNVRDLKEEQYDQHIGWPRETDLGKKAIKTETLMTIYREVGVIDDA